MDTTPRENDSDKTGVMSGTRWAWLAIFILLVVMAALALFPDSAASLAS